MNKQGYTVLERYPNINYAIVDRGEKSYQRYIATWYLNEDDPDHLYWSQGHYFETLYEAVSYVRNLLTGSGINDADLEAEFGDEIDITDTYPTGWSDYMSDYDWLKLNGGN